MPCAVDQRKSALKNRASLQCLKDSMAASVQSFLKALAECSASSQQVPLKWLSVKKLDLQLYTRKLILLLVGLYHRTFSSTSHNRTCHQICHGNTCQSSCTLRTSSLHHPFQHFSLLICCWLVPPLVVHSHCTPNHLL